MIKPLLKKLIAIPPKLLVAIFALYEAIVAKVTSTDYAYSNRMAFFGKFDVEKHTVSHKKQAEKIKFEIYTPNRQCLFRQETFSTKEPEMLEWIDKYGGEGALYDIGANIGIYSIYYAKTQPGNVYSFEPSVFNLRQLGKNISINALSQRITIISNPLSNKTGSATFINSNIEEGGALNAFGVNYGHDGKPINNLVEYSVLGFALDDLLQLGALKERPTLIKIDVDGIEHLILSGAAKTLALDSLKSVFIEVNDDFKEQRDNVKILLEDAGFSLLEKRHSEMVENSEDFRTTYNQIWVRE